MKKEIENHIKQVGISIFKQNEELWITTLDNSVIQFDISQIEARICIYVAETTDNHNSTILSSLMEAMCQIANQSDVELIFNHIESNYSLRVRLENALDNAEVFSEAIENLLWAHNLLFHLSLGKQKDTFNSFFSYSKMVYA